MVRRPGSPHENGRNSETKNRTLDPKVPKRTQRRGLRAPFCQKTRSHTKKRIFGPKSGFLGPKKTPLLRPNHVLATTGQSCQKKKVPFSQMNISLLANFGFFFWKNTYFRPVFHFSAKRKNGRFSVNPAGTGSVVIVGHFFGDPDGPNKFR